VKQRSSLTRLLAWPAASTLVAAGWQQPSQPTPATNPAETAKQAPTSLAQPVARTTATLHQAWLAEVMDLDHHRATEIYREVARDKVPDNLERWVAVARLAELHRLGVAAEWPIDPIEVPPPLRASLAAVGPPLDVDALTKRVSSDPALLMQSLGSDSGKLPVLRPAVADAEIWLISQVASWRDRFRQRQQSQAARLPFTERFYAMRIVIAELEGRRTQADEVRALYFTQWHPPVVSADHGANLARVRANLEALLGEREMAGAQSLLNRLREAIDKEQATDPAAAMGLLLRLPYFSELLLQDDQQRRR